MADVHDELRFLAHSSHRSTVLMLLSDSAPRTRSELEPDVDATRRTVNRTVEALEDRGYVDETPAGYRLTAYGSALAGAYTRFVSETTTPTRFHPFLSNVDPEVFDLNPRHLDGSDLLLASESSPFALLDRTLELRRESAHIREIAPGVEKKSVTQLAERVRGDDPPDVEVVLPASAAMDAMANPDYSDAHREIARSDAVDTFVYPGDTALFVGLFDDTATLGAMDQGRPVALVESTNPTVFEWAVRTFRQYREDAQRHAAFDAPGQ